MRHSCPAADSSSSQTMLLRVAPPRGGTYDALAASRMRMAQRPPSLSSCLRLLCQQGPDFVVGEPLELRQDGSVLIRAGLLDQAHFYGFGQLGHRESAAVDDIQRQLYLVGLADAREQLHRQQGMPAEVKEVIVDAHRGEAQKLGPQRGKLLLELGARRGRRTVANRAIAGGGPHVFLNLGRPCAAWLAM